MHTCIHAYMHTCIHAYMHTCIHAYMHTCMDTYTLAGLGGASCCTAAAGGGDRAAGARQGRGPQDTAGAVPFRPAVCPCTCLLAIYPGGCIQRSGVRVLRKRRTLLASVPRLLLHLDWCCNGWRRCVSVQAAH